MYEDPYITQAREIEDIFEWLENRPEIVSQIDPFDDPEPDFDIDDLIDDTELDTKDLIDDIDGLFDHIDELIDEYGC